MSYSLMMTLFCCFVFLIAVSDLAWARYKKRDNYKRPFYLTLALMWFCLIGIYVEGDKEAKNYAEMISWGLILISIMCSGMGFKVKHQIPDRASDF